MNTEHEAPLALELAQLANRLDADENRQTGELEDPQRLLRSVERFGELARISADLQAQAVRSAHEAGISWAKIGAHLGISRQAVQQRFDPSYHHDEPIPEQTRVLGPVSRAEEVEHLNAAAAEGWRPIRSLPGQHIMQHDGVPWEVQRVSVLTTLSMPAKTEGWRAASTRFPDCFYIRKRDD
ncbi:MAG TPA: hypothetical protein VK095_02780 [Beutenbergiaceae bacterium]|nr:hypothetical protein [Beutenbergiaceae bacterium]